MSEKPLVNLHNVTRTYGDVGPTVLRGVNLTIQTGERIAVIGPSGCGKSTLLNIIGTLDRPTVGDVTFDGRDVTGLSDNELADLRSEAIGFVFQDHLLLPQCSAMENVLIPAVGGGGVTDAVRQRAHALLEKVRLADRADHLPGALSGGEKQRVAVVRALINEPKLLLADEPTGSLDGKSADALADLLVGLDVTLVVVTHAPALAERMQKVYTLRDGVLEDA